MTRHDWMGKGIHWELSKKLKFDHANKWYMLNPESVLGNETHWDIDIQTDHLISARRPDLIIIDKKDRTYKIIDFAVPSDHRVQLKECVKRDISTSTLLGNWKKCWTCKWRLYRLCAWYGHQKIGSRTGRLGRRMETVQTTALLRSAGILRSVLEIWRDLLSLKLMWKTIC